MNKNIDLTKILKDCPKGTKLYSTIYGDVKFSHISKDSCCPIILHTYKGGVTVVTKYGKHNIDYETEGECVLFPSKDQRDWSKFTAPWYKKLIESKFNVGQYITDGYVVGQITSIEDEYHCYKILDFMSGVSTTIPFTLQDNYHFWTIKDAKDGDALAVSWLKDKNLWEKIIIFKKYHSEGVKGLYSMPCIEGYGNTFKNREFAFPGEKEPYYSKTWTCYLHPATKEQRDFLFQKIKEAGYKWKVETKTLEKLIQPKFKVGDKIVNIPMKSMGGPWTQAIISEVTNDKYIFTDGSYIQIGDQDNWELVINKKEKFDPKTLKPFDKVLVSDEEGKYEWTCKFFSHYRDCKLNKYRYTTTANVYKYCIPYNDDTKQLVGTKDEAPEYYRYWEE